MTLAQTLGALIIDDLGNIYCFLFFGVISLAGLIFSYLFVKDSTFGILETPESMFQSDQN
jgi:hypothetical protein